MPVPAPSMIWDLPQALKQRKQTIIQKKKNGAKSRLLRLERTLVSKKPFWNWNRHRIQTKSQFFQTQIDRTAPHVKQPRTWIALTYRVYSPFSYSLCVLQPHHHQKQQRLKFDGLDFFTLELEEDARHNSGVAGERRGRGWSHRRRCYQRYSDRECTNDSDLIWRFWNRRRGTMTRTRLVD